MKPACYSKRILHLGTCQILLYPSFPSNLCYEYLKPQCILVVHVFLLSIYSERPLFPSVRTLTLGLLLFLSCSLYCSLVLHSLPPFLSSLTKSIGGIPHLSKTNIRICLLVFSSLSIPSYCWDSLQILQFVNLCRFFSFFLFLVWGVELLGNHNQHMQVKAVKKI